MCIRDSGATGTGGAATTFENVNVLPVGAIVALHCPAHGRFLRLEGETVRATAPASVGRLPDAWLDARFIVVAAPTRGPPAIALWSPVHSRFVRVDGQRVDAKGGVTDVGALTASRSGEQLVVVDMGNGYVALRARASGRLICMHAAGKVSACSALNGAGKADKGTRFVPVIIG